MDMDKLVSLCKRRGFLFQSSEIYGGLNGFWDYGPLGVELKRNIKEAWWRDMVTGHDELVTPAGAPSTYEMVGLDCTIIMHPQVWKCSRALRPVPRHDGRLPGVEEALSLRPGSRPLGRGSGADASSSPRLPENDGRRDRRQRAQKFFNLRAKDADRSAWHGEIMSLAKVDDLKAGARARRQGARHAHRAARVQPDVQDHRRRDGQRGGRRLPAARNGPGHLRQLQERLRQHAGAGAVRHRPDRQELPQRDHAAELHVPLARVRADGDRVLLPSERRRASGTSTGATAG